MVKVAASKITVEVVYALPQTQTVIVIEVPLGSTIRQALTLSKIAARHSEIDLDNAPVGIFGRRLAAETVLNDCDRIEIYRSLRTDPKQARRHAALRKKRRI